MQKLNIYLAVSYFHQVYDLLVLVPYVCTVAAIPHYGALTVARFVVFWFNVILFPGCISLLFRILPLYSYMLN